MKKKIILSVSVSFVLLLCTVLAALNAIFTLATVTPAVTAYSEAGNKEAAELCKDLEGLLGKSTVFFDEEEVHALMKNYPCFQIDEVKKEMPRTLSVAVSERLERYAVEREGGYAVVASDGTYLYEKEKNENRLDGEANILLQGFTGLDFSAGERVTGGRFDVLLSAIDTFGGEEGDLDARMNIVSVFYEQGASDERTTSFTIRMREGTRIEINNLTSLASEKAKAAFERYFELDDEDKMFGVITVNDDLTSGGFFINYTTHRDLT